MCVPLYTRCHRCNKRLPSGSKCGCFTERISSKQREVEKKVVNPFYSTSAWQTKRQSVMAKYSYMDVYKYFLTGEIAPADLVHHIVPLRESRELALNDDNLIPVSTESHHIIESEYSKGGLVKKEMQELLKRAKDEWQGE